MTIRGNPARLEAYSETTLATVPPTRADVDGYRSTLAALARAPSDLSPGVLDRSGWIDVGLDEIVRVDRRPAAFAFALRQLDHFVPDTPRDRAYLYTNDAELFDALVAARLSDPDATADEVYRRALDQLTGTPQALAADFESVIDEITAAMDRDDVRSMQGELLQLISALRQNAWASDPPLTEDDIIEQAWVALSGRGDDGIVPAALVEHLGDLTDRLGRRRYDRDYTTAFFTALGPDATALLPDAIALSGWSDRQRTANDPQFDVDDALISVDVALAQASPSLDASWLDSLFGHAVDDGRVADAFPLLFEYGQYSAPFAERAGQLGVDILHGAVTVDRGVGSPGYPNFDALATHWEDRGTLLLDAAARTPSAATALLRDEDNASWLTSDTFGRDGRHPPDWDVIEASVGRLVVSGTVANAMVDPEGARRAAISVITHALDEGPGDAADALASAYGAMTVEYLPDFSRSPAFNAPPVYDTVDGDHIQIGAYQAAQFVSLAMGDDDAARQILRLRDVLDLQLAVDGMQGEIDNPPWQQRMANVDGIVLSAANGEAFITAQAEDDAANEYNQNIDLLQDVGLSIVGLKWELPGPLGVLAEEGLDRLKESYLYHDANNVEQAGHSTSVANFTLFDHERFVLAEAELVIAVHDEVNGDASDPQRALIERSTDVLGADYVDAMRAAANGDTSVTYPDVEEWRLKDFAGFASLTDFTTVSNYTDLLLPADPQGLW